MAPSALFLSVRSLGSLFSCKLPTSNYCRRAQLLIWFRVRVSFGAVPCAGFVLRLGTINARSVRSSHPALVLRLVLLLGIRRLRRLLAVKSHTRVSFPRSDNGAPFRRRVRSSRGSAARRLGGVSSCQTTVWYTRDSRRSRHVARVCLCVSAAMRRSSSYNVSCGKGQRSGAVLNAPCRRAGASSLRDAMTSRRLAVGWRGLRIGVAWHRGRRKTMRMRAQRLGLRGCRQVSSSKAKGGGARGVDGRWCLEEDGAVEMRRQDPIPKELRDLRNEWTSRLEVGGWRRWGSEI